MGQVNELKDFTRGQIDAILMKIGQDVGMGTGEGLRAFLSGELVVRPAERIWKTWKTIKLGTFKNVDEIRWALKTGGCSTSRIANLTLNKITVSKIKQDVELVEVSNEELGLRSGAYYADTCKCAFKLGLEYCPAELGPQLCLQYKDQPKGTFVIVAMEAIADAAGNLFIFDVERSDDGRQYFSIFNVSENRHFFGSNARFVFLRRK